MPISRTDRLPISLLLAVLVCSTVGTANAEVAAEQASNRDLQIVSPAAPAKKPVTKPKNSTATSKNKSKIKSETGEGKSAASSKKTDKPGVETTPNHSTTIKDNKSGADSGFDAGATAKPATPAAKSGSEDSKPDPPKSGDANSQADKKSLVDAENSFGLSSYRNLGDASPAQNIFISPYSLHSCLHLVFNGAAGDTLSEMAKTLGLSSSTRAKGDEEYKQLSEQVLSADGGDSPSFVFSTANSIWANKNIKLNSEFVDTAKKTFAAEVRNLDFSQADSVSAINNWVSENTRKRIPKILDKLDSQDALVALNAAYFKARWKSEFNKQWTKEADFKAPSDLKKVSMMDARGSFNYFENDQLQAIELPYVGGKASMVVFLPREKSSLADLRHALLVSNYDKWLNAMESLPGEIFLPKFKLEYNVSCRGFLQAQGMKAPFSDTADFSAMITPPPQAKISQVVHKTFVKVDEEGTEAAAATAVVERALSLMVQKQQEPFKMVVDRPFIYALVDWKTHAILFVGQVVDPTQG